MSLFLKSGRVVTFRTDEWREDTVLNRLKISGETIINMERELVVFNSEGVLSDKKN